MFSGIQLAFYIVFESIAYKIDYVDDENENIFVYLRLDIDKRKRIIIFTRKYCEIENT